MENGIWPRLKQEAVEKYTQTYAVILSPGKRAQLHHIYQNAVQCSSHTWLVVKHGDGLQGRHSTPRCCSMYCLITASGAPPHVRMQ